jgi:hypothetical protein
MIVADDDSYTTARDSFRAMRNEIHVAGRTISSRIAVFWRWNGGLIMETQYSRAFALTLPRFSS